MQSQVGVTALKFAALQPVQLVAEMSQVAQVLSHAWHAALVAGLAKNPATQGQVLPAPTVLLLVELQLVQVVAEPEQVRQVGSQATHISALLSKYPSEQGQVLADPSNDLKFDGSQVEHCVALVQVLHLDEQVAQSAWIKSSYLPSGHTQVEPLVVLEGSQVRQPVASQVAHNLLQVTHC